VALRSVHLPGSRHAGGAPGTGPAALDGFLAVGITLAGLLYFGTTWWPRYLLSASGVALTLLLTPDPYTAFGLVWLTAVGAALLWRATPRNVCVDSVGGPSVYEEDGSTHEQIARQAETREPAGKAARDWR
jgi:hypothetical protein